MCFWFIQVASWNVLISYSYFCKVALIGKLEMFLSIPLDMNNKLSPKIIMLLTVRMFQKREVILSSVLLLCGCQSKRPETKCYWQLSLSQLVSKYVQRDHEQHCMCKLTWSKQVPKMCAFVFTLICNYVVQTI